MEIFCVCGPWPSCFLSSRLWAVAPSPWRSLEAEPGDPLPECWLAHERLRVSEARSINCAGILTARTDIAAEAVEVSAAEASFAEDAAAAEAAAAGLLY